jgi:hypothetical protein
MIRGIAISTITIYIIFFIIDGEGIFLNALKKILAKGAGKAAGVAGEIVHCPMDR